MRDEKVERRRRVNVVVSAVRLTERAIIFVLLRVTGGSAFWREVAYEKILRGAYRPLRIPQIVVARG